MKNDIYDKLRDMIETVSQGQPYGTIFFLESFLDGKNCEVIVNRERPGKNVAKEIVMEIIHTKNRVFALIDYNPEPTGCVLIIDGKKENISSEKSISIAKEILTEAYMRLQEK